MYEEAECHQHPALSAWRRSFCDRQFRSRQRQSDPSDVRSTGHSLQRGSLLHRNGSVHWSVQNKSWNVYEAGRCSRIDLVYSCIWRVHE